MTIRATVVAASVAFLLLNAGSARADSLAYNVFVAGDGGGEPGTAKQATVFSLYGLAAVSLVGSAYFATEWSSSARELDDLQAREPQACSDFLSDACAATKRVEVDTNRNLNLALGGVAAGMTLTLSGVLLARFWDNEVQPSAVVVPGGGYLSVRAAF